MVVLPVLTQDMYHDPQKSQKSPPGCSPSHLHLLYTNSFKTAPDFTAYHMNMNRCSPSAIRIQKYGRFLLLHNSKRIKVSPLSYIKFSVSRKK